MLEKLKKHKILINAISILLLAIGILLFTAPDLKLTGAFIGCGILSNFILARFFGIVLVIFGIVLFTVSYPALENITLSSSIKRHPSLLRLTQNAVGNPKIERELNHLIDELKKGNLGAGLGYPGHVPNTNIYYLRGRRGARLYYRQIRQNGYEIVAKSAKGRNQDEVISRLRKIYRK